MSNRTGAFLLITAMAFGSGVAIKTSYELERGTPPPKVLPDYRIRDLPEFIITETINGKRDGGWFTKRHILTAGGLACTTVVYSWAANGPAPCEVNQPVPYPERFVSLTAPYKPAPPFKTTESDHV